MAAKFFVLLSVLAVSHAIPLWIVNNPVPGAYIANGLVANPLPEVPPEFPPVFPYTSQYSLSAANAQNLGQSGSAYSSSLTDNQKSLALAAAQNNNPALWSSQSASSLAANRPYGSALSSAQSSGIGYGSAISSAKDAPGYQSATSLANRQNGPWNYGNSFSSAVNNGAYKASIANTVQQDGNLFQKSGASSISAPGLQAANSQAIQAGL